jgi:hypothetical protein
VLNPSEIHRRVQAAIAGALPSWYPSRHSYEDLPSVPDGAEVAHQSYAVALPTSEWQAGRQPRSRTEGQQTSTELRVRWLYRIRVEARDTDYRAALDAEVDLLRAILATGGDRELHVQLAGPVSRRDLSSATGPMLLGELDFVIHHQIALVA